MCYAGKSQEDILSELYHAALNLKDILKGAKNFNSVWPPTSSDFERVKVKSSIPVLVYNFLAWTIGRSDDALCDTYVPLKHSKDETLVMPLAQDLIHATSKGSNATAKSMAFGIQFKKGYFSFSD